jgi:hypothetical protein
MADEILAELFINKLSVSKRIETELQCELFLLIHEKLESTPEDNQENNPDDYGRYTPTSFIILLKQIIGQIDFLVKKCFSLEKNRSLYRKRDIESIDFEMDVFTKSEIKIIKEFCNKIVVHESIEEDLHKFSIGSVRQFERSNYLLKVEILNYYMDRPQYCDIFTGKNIKKIRELFSKLPSSSSEPYETVKEELPQKSSDSNKPYKKDQRKSKVKYSEYLSPVEEEILEKDEIAQRNENIQKYGKKLINYLVKRFKMKEDRDFVVYLRDTPLNVLVPEIMVYNQKGTHHNESDLFIKYIGERKPEACNHTAFAAKVTWALGKLEKNINKLEPPGSFGF